MKKAPQDGKFSLPFGFVQSPLLASISLHFSSLGHTIENIARQNEIRISVCMDDIIISGTDESIVNQYLDAIKNSGQEAGFFFNEEKTVSANTSIRAFNIDISSQPLSICSERMREFRNFLSHANSMQFAAVIAYVRSINPGQAASLQESCGQQGGRNVP